MMDLIAEHIAAWTVAEISQTNGGRGRGRGANGQSPHGIKKLRELILELAVRGKLVEQDPSDEPASVLLEKIAKEKARLVKECKIKKQKPLSKIAEDEKPFESPAGWAWARFGTLVNSLLSGGTPSKRNPEYWNGDIPWASVKDLGKSKYLEDTQDHITQKGLNAGSKLAEIDDVIICTRMGLGKIAIAKARIAINQDLKAIKLTSLLDVDFFLNFFATLNIKGTGTTVEGIRQEKLLDYVVCLPPLAEQHRIVAKVDELMALCDKLEQQQTDSNGTHQTLVETLLATHTASTDQAEFSLCWQRIAAHFDTLFTTEESIDQLKQTILQLAVMGKLVEQDPNDEPASVLLEKIAKEKAKLIKEGKIKKQNPLPKISDDEKPFELPEGWAWARFPELGEFGRGKSKHRPRNDPSLYSDGKYPMVQTGDVARANGIVETYTALYNDKGLAQSRLWPKGTMCITIAANIADSGILGFDACFPDSVVGLIPSKQIGDSRYFEYFMRTAKENLMAFAPSTAQKNINLGILETVYIPLPPADENKRIVAKVDKLMALCDTLKASLHKAQTTQIQLADAIVEQAVAA